jgi:predicted nucleic acid-binding protein
MKKRQPVPGLFQNIIDASSLINIQRLHGKAGLEKIKDDILIPRQIAEEVAFHPKVRKNDPLRKFVIENPTIVTDLQGDEENEFYRLASEPGIDEGEAAAMAIALKRGWPLIIDERETKATGKAKSLGIKTIHSRDFVKSK